MSAIEELRQNDPAMKSIRIRLSRETSDAALAQALEQNPFVTDIVLNLNNVQQTDWNSLVHVIATRASLGKVQLKDSRYSRPNAALVRSICRAISQNRAIRSLEFDFLRLPIDTISTCLGGTTSSITSFSVCGLNMEPPTEREAGARSLALALQRNTNIETLKLNSLEDIFAIPISEGLGINTSVKTFIFYPASVTNISDAASRALHQLLESTTSIQRFELGLTTFNDRYRFRPIAQGIINSECLSELKLSWCHFMDHESFAQLQSILQDKRNLTSLCLHGCSFGGEQVHSDIISLLSQPDSPVRCFEYQNYGDLERAFPGVQFKNLLQVVQNCKLLERFSIGSIQTQQQLQTLTQSIPLMHIRELEVVFEGHSWREDVNSRQNLLQAVKNNFRLRSVKVGICVNHSSSDFFDSDDDKQRLAFYANRNESLDQWVAHPETVEQRKVWPEALGLAERAGPTALFRGMRSVLERDYGSLPGKRKRKRPQYYTPA